MDAAKVSEELIRKIESSKLNYKISRTPYSAKIWVKSSFVNPLNQEDAPPVKVHVLREQENLTNPDVIKLSEQAELLMNEKVKLEDLLKQEQLKEKSLEVELKESQEESLRIERENELGE